MIGLYILMWLVAAFLVGMAVAACIIVAPCAIRDAVRQIQYRRARRILITEHRAESRRRD